ncbi:MAG: ribosome assembly cofactor RimP [Bacteroidota bacterium]
MSSKIEGTEVYLVEIKVTPAKVTVILDHPKNLGLEVCVAISRYLQEQLEESNVFESHELEVTSPGMEEPLRVLQQYRKRTGQRVSVITFDGLKRTGKLVAADAEGILLEEESIKKEGKKKILEVQPVRLPFTSIKETRVLFSFDKIKQ